MDGYAWEVPDLSLFDKLNTLREIVGPITITSGYRTERFNASVGGSKNSYHLKGLAVDIKFDFRSRSQSEWIKLFIDIGFKNIGLYRTNGVLQRVHLDIGNTWNGKQYYIFYKEA